MSVSEKLVYFKQLIALVCDTIPVIVSLIKEIVVTMNNIKTV